MKLDRKIAIAYNKQFFLLPVAVLCFLNLAKRMVRGKGYDMNRSVEKLEVDKVSNKVIIVGAGIAGSALAHALAKDGRRVHLIERNLAEPNRISGELLQPAGYLKLKELGLEDCIEEIDAQLVLGYVICKDGKSIPLPYPLKSYSSDVAGRSFHNGRFVQRLREKAASLPNVKLEQGTITSLIEEKGMIKGVRYKKGTGQELIAYAPLTVVCDGCFSSLRKFVAKPRIHTASHFAGLIIENYQLPHPNYSYVVLGNPSSFALYSISSTEVRFQIDFPGSAVPSVSNGDMANFLKTLVAPQVPPEMRQDFIRSVDKVEIRVMPTSSMPARPHLIPGALLLGDALNMRHAITGGGMTVALNDVVLVRNLFKNLELDDSNAVTKQVEHFYHMRKPEAFTINLMANSIHKVVFASSEGSRDEIQKACFNYFFHRHMFSGGLVGLISGLDPLPWRLVFHLFIIALYIIGHLLFGFPSMKRVQAAVNLALGALTVLIPVVKQVCFAGNKRHAQ